MARQISASVGRMGGKNRRPDVLTVQDLLNRVPPHQGGPVPPLVVDGLCGSKTIKAIQKFQLHHFGWRGADGRVDPNGQTHTKLNEYDRKQPTPGYPPPLTTSSALQCPHGGTVIPGPSRGWIPAPIGGLLPLQPDGAHTVTGCPFTRGGGRPSPCVRVQWLAASRGPLTMHSVGTCYSAENIPQGRVRVVRV